MSVTKTGTFTVGKVNDHEVNKTFEFEYRQFQTLDEAQAVYSNKDFLDFANDYEKNSSKANKYQDVTKEFRPDPNDPAVKREMLIKNLEKTFGVPRAIAEQQIDAMIKASKPEEKTEEPATT